jgi:hypothetical protein
VHPLAQPRPYGCQRPPASFGTFARRRPRGAIRRACSPACDPPESACSVIGSRSRFRASAGGAGAPSARVRTSESPTRRVSCRARRQPRLIGDQTAKGKVDDATSSPSAGGQCPRAFGCSLRRSPLSRRSAQRRVSDHAPVAGPGRGWRGPLPAQGDDPGGEIVRAGLKASHAPGRGEEEVPGAHRPA